MERILLLTQSLPPSASSSLPKVCTTYSAHCNIPEQMGRVIESGNCSLPVYLFINFASYICLSVCLYVTFLDIYVFKRIYL